MKYNLRQVIIFFKRVGERKETEKEPEREKERERVCVRERKKRATNLI